LLPIDLTGVTLEKQKAFYKLLFECPNPVFAYCHSGTRPTMLWAEFNIEYNYKYMGQSAPKTERHKMVPNTNAA
jgi:protein tyrosine phosphatase (PTP) superfamily phosphohydrolase (DUF442 family)